MIWREGLRTVLNVGYAIRLERKSGLRGVLEKQGNVCVALNVDDIECYEHAARDELRLSRVK